MQNDFNLSLDFGKMLLEISKEKKRLRNQVISQERKEKVYNDFTDALIDINCRECDSLHIKEIDGYYTCLECGLKNECVIDCGQDWRFYGNDEMILQDVIFLLMNYYLNLVWVLLLDMVVKKLIHHGGLEI